MGCNGMMCDLNDTLKLTKEEQEILLKQNPNFSMIKEKPSAFCFGVTNRCRDGSYVFFADYDRIQLNRLLMELDSLINRFPNTFSNFLIMESSSGFILDDNEVGSYHVICFTKFPYQKICEILSYTTVDPLFYKMLNASTFRSNTLRISAKFNIRNNEIIKSAPKFVCWYPSQKLYSELKISYSHLKYYVTEFSLTVKHDFSSLLDGESWIEVNRYETKG